MRQRKKGRSFPFKNCKDFGVSCDPFVPVAENRTNKSAEPCKQSLQFWMFLTPQLETYFVVLCHKYSSSAWGQ